MRAATSPFATPDGRAAAIRPAHPGEAGALLDHLVRVHAAEPRANPAPDYTGDSLRALIAELRDADGGLLLVAATADGAVVGSLALRPLGQRAAEVGISVHPAWRRQGVATRLLRAGIEAARGGPALGRLTLEVAPDNHPARALFESLGFADEGPGERGLLRMALPL